MFALYYIEQVSYGCGDGITFHIRWNGARMIIALLAEPQSSLHSNIFPPQYFFNLITADNVLVHPHTDEAWLIDFGGWNTEGWLMKT
ncbi:hypothetical protein HRG_012127 [Hirsutella rhossiliensis]